MNQIKGETGDFFRPRQRHVDLPQDDLEQNDDDKENQQELAQIAFEVVQKGQDYFFHVCYSSSQILKKRGTAFPERAPGRKKAEPAARRHSVQEESVFPCL